MNRNTEFTPRTLVPSLEKRIRELEATLAAVMKLPEHHGKQAVRLEEKNTELRMRIDELTEGIEHVNRVGVLKNRDLKARNAVLEAVHEAAETYLDERLVWICAGDTCPICGGDKGPGRHKNCERAALQKALAAVKPDAPEPPQEAQEQHVTEPCSQGGPDYP